MLAAGNWGSHIIDIVTEVDGTVAAVVCNEDTKPHTLREALSPPLVEFWEILHDQSAGRAPLGVLPERQLFDIVHGLA